MFKNIGRFNSAAVILQVILLRPSVFKIAKKSC